MSFLEIVYSGGLVTATILCAWLVAMATCYEAFRHPIVRNVRLAYYCSFGPLAIATVGIPYGIWESQHFFPNRPIESVMTTATALLIEGLIFTAIPFAYLAIQRRRSPNAPAIAV